MRSTPSEVPQPDLTTFMMARAMAEMFQDDPDSRMPEPLAAILRQMERWEDGHRCHSALNSDPFMY